MSAKQRIRGPMRERLLSFLQAANHFISHPGQFDDPYGCAVGMAMYFVAAISLLAVLYMGGKIAYDFTQTPEERAASEQTTPAGAGATASGESASPSVPVAENPTAVGQAVHAIAQPAIEEVYGEALLQSAPSVEAPIVSLQYAIPTNPEEGDGERLREALIGRGARLDADNGEMDYHAGEEFVLLMDTGNPAYKSIRVSISPELKMVYVNADRSD
ncbi:MAG: hypothetical protein RBS17_11415 [Coriobacteriia bacterium]|nr:hypothetical protein [Coriobacteriia bacterium]